MSTSDSKDPAAERRARLQALRERRPTAGAGDATQGAASAGGNAGAGARRPGGAGAGGGGKNRGAQVMQMLKNNPEKANEVMQRFPQLREIMEQRRKAGGGGAMGGARGPGRLGAGPRGAAPAAGAGADAALHEQIRALERRVAELGETLEKTRNELADGRRENAAPAQAPAVTDGTQASAARAKLATLKKSAPKK